jgi:hypothetical protein
MGLLRVLGTGVRRYVRPHRAPRLGPRLRAQIQAPKQDGRAQRSVSSPSRALPKGINAGCTHNVYRCLNSRFAAGEYLLDARTGFAVHTGHDGVVMGADGEPLYSYFLPRLEASGWITLDPEGGTKVQVEKDHSHSGWYEHAFGGKALDAEISEGGGASGT